MIDELTEVAALISRHDRVRAVVLAGNGRIFCAGGDLDWMKTQIDSDRHDRMREAKKLASMLKALNELPVPLIGKLHGGAFGGGVGLACVCDAAIATSETVFALSETRLGLLPATIGPYVVARIGEANARRLMLLARRVDASEACTLGLIAGHVASDELDAAIEQEIEPVFACAPGAVTATKSLVRRLGPVIDDALIDMTIERLADAWETDEAREGIAAFLGKRPARWMR